MQNAPLDPRACAHEAMRKQAEPRVATIEENKKRRERFLETLSLPPWNVWKMLEDAKNMVGEAFTRVEKNPTGSIGAPTLGTIADWAQVAERSLRKEIRRMIRQGGDPDGSLEQQLLAVFPDEAPPRELDKEELAQLVEIQEQVDLLIENLTDTVDDALHTLWGLVLKEHQIVHDTNAGFLIRKQADAFADFLEGRARHLWGKHTGRGFGNPKYNRPFMHTGRKWSR